MQQSDLVDLDLEDLFQKCQAELPQSVGLQDLSDFASDLLLNAAKKGHPFSQYYVGRCFEQGTLARIQCTKATSCMWVCVMWVSVINTAAGVNQSC